MPDLLRSLSLGRLPSDEQLEDLRQLFGQEVSSDR
jgi:hypothetical protein